MKKNKNNIILGLFVTMIIVCAIAVFFLNTTSKINDYVLNDYLKIASIQPYTGNFVEDGSDEEVENIMSIIIENVSDEWIEYGQITINDEENYEFKITTIPPKSKVQVLESNKKQYSKNINKEKIQLNHFAKYLYEPQLFKEYFDITLGKGYLDIANKTQNDLDGEIIIYYKNEVDNMYLGGITYRVRIEDGIKKNSMKSVFANHLSSSSEILFVTYAK